MAKQVLCDNFRQEHFVPARQVRSVLSVYVASREERSACNGLGCAVKDLMTGEEKRMKISELMKMRVQFPNGKPVKAYSLKGGHTYTMIGVPVQQNFSVFIVPRGESSYEFWYKDRPLSPMSVILFDGKNTRVIDYRAFRKLFIMLPNPVSSGQMRRDRAGMANLMGYGQARQSQAQAPTAFDMFRRLFRRLFRRPQPTQQPVQPIQRPVQPQPQPQAYQRPQGFPQGMQYPQASPANEQAQTNTVQLRAVGRIMCGNKLVGLVLSDGKLQQQVPYQQCWNYASKGRISNVKAVRRGKEEFLSGVGMSLDDLPTMLI
jgi:hypothetical protein